MQKHTHTHQETSQETIQETSQETIQEATHETIQDTVQETIPTATTTIRQHRKTPKFNKHLNEGKGKNARERQERAGSKGQKATGRRQLKKMY